MKQVKQGVCTIHGGYNYPQGKFISSLHVCPCCGQRNTCDMWIAEVSDDWEPNDNNSSGIEIDPSSEWDGHCSVSTMENTVVGSKHKIGEVNTFPSGSAGDHKSVLFIFIGDQDINLEMFNEYVNYRIREHIKGNPTSELRIVARGESEIIQFFGWNINRKYRSLCKLWKTVDTTFSDGRIIFQDYTGLEFYNE